MSVDFPEPALPLIQTNGLSVCTRLTKGDIGKPSLSRDGERNRSNGFACASQCPPDPAYMGNADSLKDLHEC